MNLHEVVSTLPRPHHPASASWWSSATVGSCSPGSSSRCLSVGLLFRGLNLSIDFEGGAQLQYAIARASASPHVTDILMANGHADSEVQIVNGDTVSIRTSTLTERRGRARQAPGGAGDAGRRLTDDINQQDVGPTWGPGDLEARRSSDSSSCSRRSSPTSGFRFEWKMAFGANVALVHDLIITAGVYALVGSSGDARHRHRHPHHPRVLALRHGGHLRQDQGEHRDVGDGLQARLRRNGHLLA